MKKVLAVLLAAVMLMSVMAGCGNKGQGETPKAESGGTFTVALDSDIVKLDPAFAYDFTTNNVVNQITEGLLSFNDKNELQPNLASDWKMVDDTTYVYTIRDDVTFSDGKPMTMDDVLFSLERVRNPENASNLNWMYSSVASIEQTGDWELTVKLSAPSATWQYVFATTAGHVISKEYYEGNQDEFGVSGLVGTGPFVLDKRTEGQEIVLTRNENYWDKDAKIDIDKLVFKIIPEDTTRVVALQNGEVDFTPNTPLDMLDTVKADDKLEVQGVETLGITYLAFNTQREPFNDPNVRKAIYHAINMDSLHDDIIKDAGNKASVLPQGSSLYGTDPAAWEDYAAKAPVYEYNVEKAKEYMAKSSVPDGFQCTLLVSDTSLRYTMALALQEYLKAINIEMEIIKLPTDEHTAYQFADKSKLDENGIRDYDMILAGWEADFPDVSGNIEPLYASANAGEGGANAAAYQNETVDSLITQQSQLTDPAERNQLLFQALDIITEDVPYIFMDYPVKQTTINKKYTGFTMNASWMWNLYFKDIHPAADGE